MALGLDDIALSSIKESAKEVLKETCKEAEYKSEIIGENSDSSNFSFKSSDFAKSDVKTGEEFDSNQFDNLSISPKAVQVEKIFQPCNFEEIKNENIEGSNALLPETDSQNTVVSTESQEQKDYTEIHATDSHNDSDISFGNQYDDRAVDFLNECENYGIELPTSVTHAGQGVDRSADGGFLSIDKTLIETELKSALKNEKITPDVYESLSNKLTSC